MYLQIEVSLPRNKSKTFEELLYDLFPAGWETIENEKEVTFIVFLKEEEKEKIEKIKSEAGKEGKKIKILFIEDKDWNEVWKAGFKPLKVGRRLVIVPPWEIYNPEEGEVIIIIEPGQAFGTGHHPTTQMMLNNIEKFFEQRKEKERLKVLDLGCGTGILGIACAKLYKNIKVLAVDIDKEALKATNYNAKLNGVSPVVKTAEEIQETGFDLVVANIGYKELCKLAELIKNSVKIGGSVFLSGILKEDLDKLERRYLKLGFKKVYREEKEEWGFLWIEKRVS